MRIVALFGRRRIPVDIRDLPLDGDIRDIAQIDAFGRNRRDVAVIQVNDLPRVGQERRDVARNQVFAAAEPDDQRAALAGGDDEPRVVHRNDRETVGAGDLPQRGGRRGQQIAVVRVGDQVDDHFGVERKRYPFFSRWLRSS